MNVIFHFLRTIEILEDIVECSGLRLPTLLVDPGNNDSSSLLRLKRFARDDQFNQGRQLVAAIAEGWEESVGHLDIAQCQRSAQGVGHHFA